MGLGLLIVLPASDADAACRLLADEGAIIVGEIVSRTGDSVEFV
jgi:phosphoribosylaminoimidazole (AIR) synthetase